MALLWTYAKATESNPATDWNIIFMHLFNGTITLDITTKRDKGCVEKINKEIVIGDGKCVIDMRSYIYIYIRA